MPEIRINKNMPVLDVKNILLDVWGLPNSNATKIVADRQNHERLYEDYAEICAFLSEDDKVVTALKALDNAIKFKLEDPGLSALKTKVENAQDLKTNPNAYKDNTRGDKPFKTHKVLSGILDTNENTNGFNGAQGTLQKLHTTAMVAGDGTNPVAFTNYQPQWDQHVPTGTDVKNLPTVGLPKTAPTLTGILKKSFNPILLKNGFHWKDPGADAVIHGEFTHRIQWYAIVQAHGAGKLTLVNTPVQIFKSMGYLYAGKDNIDTPVYLWELLCDCFADNQSAAKGKPRSATFNCPNVLQTYLSKQMLGSAHPLPYLNVLMRARYIKRSMEPTTKTVEAIETGQKPVKYGVSSTGDIGDMGQGMIWWRKYS